MRYPGLLAKASPIFVAAIASPEDISKSIVESRLLYHKISLYKIANAMTKRQTIPIETDVCDNM